jgi:hypothetical protein
MTHQDFTALVGAWRLRSFGITFSDTGERIEPYGANPEAQPCSIISLLTPE